jgi:TonB family protein
MPIFSQNGDSVLLNYLAKNTVYPEDAKKNKVEGKVIVRFVVDTNGMISDATIITGVSPSINAEALRVVNSLPKFEKPGFVKGKPIKTFYRVPITFTLK